MTASATAWPKATRTEDLKSQFASLVQQWREERGPSSSMTKIILHPAYQRIIGMGPAALPLIFAEMQDHPDYWHWALYSITGEQPIPNDHAGNLAAMTDDWFNWAKTKGYAIEVSNRAPLSQAG